MVWINNIILDGHTGDQFILIRFKGTVPGIWTIRIQGEENQPISFHAWLPSGNMISYETYFLHSSPDTTVTAPGNAGNPLTVAAYNQSTGAILEESGRGYTRSGKIVPDITAPGYHLPCALPDGKYGGLTGTGAAAAYAAGAAALIAEWGYCKGNHTGITGNQINRMIIRSAQRNSSDMYPNNIWGYGQMDVYKILQQLSELAL